ncbi:MAG: V-type ATP synthase subunit F [Oscillospiraceae bacterium]|nr:V-type ATP synthase subunit F [Oscillospiraceae bacterium]
MYKIAVLGDRESVLGFKALGLDVHSAETVEDGRKILHRLAKDGQTAIIYLTEQYAAQMMDEVKKYKDEVMPAIILIPGKAGSMGIGMQNITDSVERAVGADIL